MHVIVSEITSTCSVILSFIFIQAAAGSVQKQDGGWVGVVAGGGDGINAVQVYDPVKNLW